MDSSTAKANEKRFFEYVNNKDVTSLAGWIDQFVAEDFVNHTPTMGVAKDRDGLKVMFRQLFELFPDMEIVIEDIVFEENVLCFRHIIRGMKQGAEINGMAMVKYRNGRITDRWAVTGPM